MYAQQILIVDDDMAVATMLRFALEDNYCISTATDAASAYEFLRDHKVDLILLDMRMPHTSGIKALEEIKKIHPDVKVIMMASYASDEDKARAMMLGAKGFLIKPFDVDVLREYIDRVLSQDGHGEEIV